MSPSSFSYEGKLGSFQSSLRGLMHKIRRIIVGSEGALGMRASKSRAILVGSNDDVRSNAGERGSSSTVNSQGTLDVDSGTVDEWTEP